MTTMLVTLLMMLCLMMSKASKSMNVEIPHSIEVMPAMLAKLSFLPAAAAAATAGDDDAADEDWQCVDDDDHKNYRPPESNHAICVSWA